MGRDHKKVLPNEVEAKMFPLIEPFLHHAFVLLGYKKKKTQCLICHKVTPSFSPVLFLSFALPISLPPSFFPSVSLTEAFALVGGSVHKHLSRDDIAKGQEHLQHLRVAELLGQVVDEDVTALWT